MRPGPDTPAARLPAAPRAGGPPTRARHAVVVFVVVLAIITYIDRVCISQAAGHIRADLGLSDTQMGWVFSAFTIMYALFEIPGGWMGDRYGPRSVLMKVVVLWSVFTAATGWPGTFPRWWFVARFSAWASGVLSQCHQDFHHLAAPAGAQQRAGHPVVECPLGVVPSRRCWLHGSWTWPAGALPSACSACWAWDGRFVFTGGFATGLRNTPA